jgi:hypothetical protein
MQILDTAIRHGLLHELCGRDTILRSSLYADDAAIFVAPLEEDMQKLSNSEKWPDFASKLSKELRSFSSKWGDQPGWGPRWSSCHAYILPIEITWSSPLRAAALRHILSDTQRQSCRTYNAEMITLDGQTPPVNFVSPPKKSINSWHLSPLTLPRGTITYISMIEIAFQWVGKARTTEGQCIVNWERVYQPKALGGLGVLIMDKFARVLRLRSRGYNGKTRTQFVRHPGIHASTQTWTSSMPSHESHSWRWTKDPFLGCSLAWWKETNGISSPFLIYLTSENKRRCIKKAMSRNGWSGKIDMNENCSMNHGFGTFGFICDKWSSNTRRPRHIRCNS